MFFLRQCVIALGHGNAEIPGKFAVAMQLAWQTTSSCTYDRKVLILAAWLINETYSTSENDFHKIRWALFHAGDSDCGVVKCSSHHMTKTLFFIPTTEPIFSITVRKHWDATHWRLLINMSTCCQFKWPRCEIKIWARPFVVSGSGKDCARECLRHRLN